MFNAFLKKLNLRNKAYDEELSTNELDAPFLPIYKNEVQQHDNNINNVDEDDEEEHEGWISQDVIRDGIIGGSDGLTVPFALTAGLTAFGDTKIVVNGGVAELMAGMISMGVGGWLAAKSELDYYNHMLQKTQTIVLHYPDRAAHLVRSIYRPYHIPPATIDPLINHLQSSSSDRYVQFIMNQKYNLPPPDPYQAVRTAVTIAMGYATGGLISLSPYFFLDRADVMKGLVGSVVVMTIALFVFGWGKVVALRGWKKVGLTEGAWEGGKMVMLGGMAAGCAYGCTRLFGGS